MKTVFSGIQPSGALHLGNYLGATRQHIEMQKNYSCIYFLADLHALTTVRNAEELQKNTIELAADYLALGLDPEKTIFFKQSDVPQHAELTWIFDCITPTSLLERAHAYKAAQKAEGHSEAQRRSVELLTSAPAKPLLIKKGKELTVGLFNYPVLMAADILLYKPDLVPVGKDQKQHIEIARDIAIKFNEHFGKTFPLPEAYIKPEVAVVPGTDGQKMSKSYRNTIDIFADKEKLKKQIMGIVTDSKSVDECKNPKSCIPFLFYEYFATSEEKESIENRLKKGGMGYGEMKKILLEKIFTYFAEARTKHAQLIKNPDQIKKILNKGSKKAQKIAIQTMNEVRKKTGLKS